MRISFVLSVPAIWLNLYLEIHNCLLLSKSRDIDGFKLAFICWLQFSFAKNLEKFSSKILIPLLFKCNLLSVMCLLGSILSSCEKNEIFLSLQVSSRRIFASFALFFHSPSLETMPDTVTVLLLLLKMSLDLLWPLQSNWLYFLFLNSLCLY